MNVGFDLKIQRLRWVMHSFLRSFLAVFTALIFSIGAFSDAAQANSFYWQDAQTKVSVAYPDTWRMIHNQKPDDVLTIVAPSDGAFPMCRIRVNEDRRSVIFPVRYSQNVQRLNYSEDFWQDYIGEFRAAKLDDYQDNAAFGRGAGSYAYISYISDALPRMKRRAIAFVSLYRDKAYVIECSAEASVYEKWDPLFRQIADQVDFRKEIYELPGGHYRYFTADDPIRIHNGNGQVSIH